MWEFASWSKELSCKLKQAKKREEKKYTVAPFVVWDQEGLFWVCAFVNSQFLIVSSFFSFLFNIP